MKLTRPAILLIFAAILSATGFYYYLLQRSHEAVETEVEVVRPASIDKLIAERYPDVNIQTVDANRKAWLDSQDRPLNQPLSAYRVAGQRQKNIADRTQFFASALQPADLSDEQVSSLSRTVMFHLGHRHEFDDAVSYSDVKEALDKLPEAARSLPLARFATLRTYRQEFSSADGAAEYETPARDLAEAEHSPLLCTLAALEEVLIRKQLTDPVEEEKLLLQQTERMVQDYSKAESTDDLRFVAELLYDIGETLTDRGRRNLLKALLKNPDIDDALIHLLAGEHYRGIAWQDRGVGFAGSVNEAGWDSFKTHMAKASLHYQRCWLLRPELPQAPDRMIMVSQSFGNQLPPRQWLELTLQANFDYPTAIWSYVHTLRPRWGGSLQQMLEFGLECVATEDFESNFANHLYIALEAIVQEAEVPSTPPRSRILSFIRDYPGLHDRLTAHWQAEQDARAEGRMASACRAADACSWRAALAMLFDDQDQLKKALDQDDKCGPTLTGFRALFEEPRIQRSLCDGLVTEHAEELRKLETKFGPDIDPGITKEELRTGLERIDALQEELNEVATDYLVARERKLEQLFRYQNDEWVHLTFEPNLDLWTVNGDVQIEDQTTAVVSSYSGFGPEVKSRIPFAPPYEIVATFELLKGRKNPVMSGIRLGSEAAIDSRIDVALIHHGQAGIYWRDPMQCHGFKMPNPSDQMTIRVHVWPGHYDAQFDGMKLPVPVRPGFEPSSTLQFGGKASQNFGAIRMSNLRVHKLPEFADPAQMAPEEASQWYERLVEIDPEDRFAKINLARVRLMQQRFGAARKLLEAASGMQGLPPESWPALGQLEAASGNFDQARQVFSRLIETNPDVPQYKIELAWLLAAAPDSTEQSGKEALHLMEPLIQQYPEMWPFKITYAAALAAVNRQDDAKSELQDALAAAPAEEQEQLSFYLKQIDENGRMELQLPQDADADQDQRAEDPSDAGSQE